MSQAICHVDYRFAIAEIESLVAVLSVNYQTSIVGDETYSAGEHAEQ